MSERIIKPKVALIQNRWRESYEDNLKNVLSMIDKICNSSPTDLIVLPEFVLGPPWTFPGKSHLKGQVDDAIPGKITDAFSEKAATYNTHILCGTMIEREGEQYYNTSTLIDNYGNIIAKARKIHIYASEMVYLKGGQEICIVDTALGKIGVCICADFWIQEMPRMLALNGAEIICIPGGSLVQNLNITRPCIQANSTYNLCYTIYSSIVGKSVGERQGRSIAIEFAGHSTIASPENIICGLEGEEGYLHAELDLDYLRKVRTVDPTYKRTLYWCLWGRKPEFYGDIQKPFIDAQQDLKTLLMDHLS